MYLGITIGAAALSFLAFLGSVLFKVLHWPGAPTLRIISFVMLGIALIFLLIYQQKTGLKGNIPKVKSRANEEKSQEEEEEDVNFWDFEDEEQ